MTFRGGHSGNPVDEDVLHIGAQFLDSVTALTNVEEDDFSRKASLSDADVKRMQYSLSVASIRLRYIANATRPINRLPSAVLLKIFHVLQNSSPSSTLFTPYSLHWTVATQVCSQWRKFALSDPVLWSRIPLRAKGGSTLINAFLTRSNGTPLTIIFGQDPLGGVHSISRVQSYLRGLRHIIDNAADRIERLVMEPHFPIDDLLGADRLGQTLGQELSRVLLIPSARVLENISSTMENSLSKLISDSMTQVRHLELWSEVVPCLLRRPYPFKHLTVLELFQAKPEISSMNSLVFSKVLAVLDASRESLRRVVLAGVHLRNDIDSSSSDGDFSPIALSSLEYIEIGDWELQGSLARFLELLWIPPSTSKCIWGNKLAPTVLGSFILPSSDSNSPNHAISRVVLSSVAEMDMISLHDSSLYINGSLAFDDYSQILETPLNLNSVHELVLTPLLKPLTVQDWTILFHLLPNIQRIKIRDAEASRLIRALRKGANGDEIHLLLPHLVEFDIKYSVAEPGLTWKELLEGESTTEASSVVVLLTLLARERAQDGAKLGRIHLRLDSRVYDFHDMDALMGDLQPQVSRLDASYGNFYSFTAEEQAERMKESKDDWYLVTKELHGIWPTKALYFLYLPTPEKGSN